MHGIAYAQAETTEVGTVNKNWVYLLAIAVLGGFLAFIGFVAVYYAFAVVARNRRFATQAVAVSYAPAGAAPARAAAPAAAPAAAQAPAAAPAAAPAQAPAAAAPAAKPAAPAAAPAGQAAGGVPRIDPNRLPDGIDAVTRGR